MKSLIEEAKKYKSAEEIKVKYGDSNPYNLSWNNLDKKIPPNYDNLVIPEIEKVTENIQGLVIKEKLYNYILSNYNKGLKEGILDSLNIFSNGKSKTFAYKIDDNLIQIKSVPIVLSIITKINKNSGRTGRRKKGGREYEKSI